MFEAHITEFFETGMTSFSNSAGTYFSAIPVCWERAKKKSKA
jgi:hypothetical protein